MTSVSPGLCDMALGAMGLTEAASAGIEAGSQAASAGAAASSAGASVQAGAAAASTSGVTVGAVTTATLPAQALDIGACLQKHLTQSL